ncbi:MAG: Fe(3+) ABC transporter substrate-binding protein [Acholeplasmatales bacterium]|nr:MAG: Fe(3+) ABC transporter substrate-binding protein [Acholeplasmatales bacterium]
MRKLLVVALLITLGILLSGCRFGSENPEQVLTIYSERHYDTDRDIYALFEAETGIKVNLVRDSADPLITRLQNEGADSPADLLIIADVGRLHRAKTFGLLQPVASTVLHENIPENYRDDEGYWFGLTRRARVIVYHPARVNPSELSTYEALTDPVWANRVVTRTSTNIYNQSLMASFIALWGEEAAKDWAAGLVANFARNPQGNDRDQAKALLAGVADVAIMNTYYIGRMSVSSDPYEQEVAQTVGIFFPNQATTGTHVNISAAGITQHAPNKEAAIRFLEFLVSETAQRLYADANFEYPINPAVEPHELLTSWGAFKAQDLPLSSLGVHATQAMTLMDEVGWE